MKPYTTPRLTAHGTVVTITRGWGTGVFIDTIFNADGTVRGSKHGSDSIDGIFCPVDEEVYRVDEFDANCPL